MVGYQLPWQPTQGVDILRLEELMKKPVLALLLVVFAAAYFLRVLYLPQKALTFGYDQARDAYSAEQILNGHLKIQGPPASTPGLSHGVLYYYFLAPAYLIGHGSPLIAAYWLAFFNAAAIFILFYLTWVITKKVFPALMSAVLFAVSFEASQYAVWLSNPTMGIWFVPAIYLGVWLWLKENKSWGALLAGLALGFSIQSDIFLGYHIWPVVLWIVVSRRQVKIKDILKFFASLIFGISSMIVAEVKYGFPAIGGISNLLFREDRLISSKAGHDFVRIFWEQLGIVTGNSFLPNHPSWGKYILIGILVVVIFDWYKEKKRKVFSWQLFLSTYIVAHIVAVPFGGSSTPFVAVGIGAGMAVSVGILLWKLFNRSGVLAIVILLLIVGANTLKIFSENWKGQTIFSIQKGMTLSNQLPAMDYTYMSSPDKVFSINSVTSPLWINIVWTYLYQWYGQNKYGYVPRWHGQEQFGQLATLHYIKHPTKTFFLILEPAQGIPGRYFEETIGEEDSRSTIAEEKHFGQVVVQKRTLTERYINEFQ